MARRSPPRTLHPRKLAVQSRSAQTVDAILGAAAHILEEDGIEAYTTNAIAQRAGVSIGSLYQYFPNKDSITIALIDREADQLVADVQAATQSPDWREALTQMISAAARHQLGRPRLARQLDIEEARLPARDVAAPLTSVIFSAVRSVLARAEIARTEPIDQMATDLMGITRGLTDMAGRAGESDLGELERRLTRAIFSYLEGSKGPTAS